MTVILPCERCAGTGYLPAQPDDSQHKARCPACNGRGYMESTETPPPDIGTPKEVQAKVSAQVPSRH